MIISNAKNVTTALASAPIPASRVPLRIYYRIEDSIQFEKLGKLLQIAGENLDLKEAMPGIPEGNEDAFLLGLLFQESNEGAILVAPSLATNGNAQYGTVTVVPDFASALKIASGQGAKKERKRRKKAEPEQTAQSEPEKAEAEKVEAEKVEPEQTPVIDDAANTAVPDEAMSESEESTTQDEAVVSETVTSEEPDAFPFMPRPESAESAPVQESLDFDALTTKSQDEEDALPFGDAKSESDDAKPDDAKYITKLDVPRDGEDELPAEEIQKKEEWDSFLAVLRSIDNMLVVDAWDILYAMQHNSNVRDALAVLRDHETADRICMSIEPKQAELKALSDALPVFDGDLILY